MEILKTLFTYNFFATLIRVATPLIFATMGAVVTSNAGITNIGLEGVMLCSALVAVLTSAFGYGPWFGLLCAILCGVICSLLIGYISLKMRANSTLTFIIFNTMASGGTIFFMYALTGDKGTTVALKSGMLPMVTIPIINKIPILGQLLSGHNVASYLAFLLILVMYTVLYRTPIGLQIRSAGEAPEALESVGVSVFRTKMISLGISGFLGGLAGAYMSMGYVSWFSKDMLAGRGFIAMAADAMGQSNPIMAALSALIFSFAEALSYTLQLTNIPIELVQMLPYLVSILGIVIYSIRVKKKKQMNIQNIKA